MPFQFNLCSHRSSSSKERVLLRRTSIFISFRRISFEGFLFNYRAKNTQKAQFSSKGGSAVAIMASTMPSSQTMYFGCNFSLIMINAGNPSPIALTASSYKFWVHKNSILTLIQQLNPLSSSSIILRSIQLSNQRVLSITQRMRLRHWLGRIPKFFKMKAELTLQMASARSRSWCTVGKKLKLSPIVHFSSRVLSFSAASIIFFRISDITSVGYTGWAQITLEWIMAVIYTYYLLQAFDRMCQRRGIASDSRMLSRRRLWYFGQQSRFAITTKLLNRVLPFLSPFIKIYVNYQDWGTYIYSYQLNNYSNCQEGQSVGVSSKNQTIEPTTERRLNRNSQSNAQSLNFILISAQFLQAVLNSRRRSSCQFCLFLQSMSYLFFSIYFDSSSRRRRVDFFQTL